MISRCKRTVAILLCCLMLASLTACGGSSSSVSTSEPTGPSRTDLNVAARALASLDPQVSTQANDVQFYRQVYEGLVKVDQYGNVEPRIAESWEQSADGMVYTFKINPNIKFHNGDKLTADDCVFSIERSAEHNIMNAYNRDIVSVSSPDDNVVEIRLSAPNSAFMFNIFQIPIVSRRAVEEMGESFAAKVNGAGTGPYEVVEYDPNVKIVLKKFADYYRPTGNIETVNINTIEEASTRLVAFEAGDLDFVDVPPSNWKTIKSNSNYKTWEQETSRVTRFVLRTYVNQKGESAVMANKNIRLALAHALNKQAIIDVAVDGLGVPADVICNPKYVKGSSAEGVTIYEYNPEKSKQLLAEAGFPNGVDVGTIIVPNQYNQPSIAQVMHAMLEDVGIRAILDQTDATTGSARAKVGDFGCMYITTSTMVGHLSSFLTRLVHTSALGTQVAKYNSPELDKLVEAGNAATTEEEMMHNYNQITKYIGDACIEIPVFYVTTAYASDPGLDAPTTVDYYYYADWKWN